MTSTGDAAAALRRRRDGVSAIVLTAALAMVSVWVVKILGPRAVNPDYFCNCSVAEGLIAMVMLPALSAGCLVAGFRLRRTRGLLRAAGIVAGIAAFSLPVAALLVSLYLPFPTIEELSGWSSTFAGAAF